MRIVEQHPFDFPDIRLRQPPVVERQVRGRAADRDARVVDPEIDVPLLRERARRERFDLRGVANTALRPCSPGSRDRATDPQRPPRW